MGCLLLAIAFGAIAFAAGFAKGRSAASAELQRKANLLQSQVRALERSSAERTHADNNRVHRLKTCAATAELLLKEINKELTI